MGRNVSIDGRVSTIEQQEAGNIWQGVDRLVGSNTGEDRWGQRHFGRNWGGGGWGWHWHWHWGLRSSHTALKRDDIRTTAEQNQHVCRGGQKRTRWAGLKDIKPFSLQMVMAWRNESMTNTKGGCEMGGENL